MACRFFINIFCGNHQDVEALEVAVCGVAERGPSHADEAPVVVAAAHAVQAKGRVNLAG